MIAHYLKTALMSREALIEVFKLLKRPEAILHFLQ
jgi:hypothetical protein